MYWMKLPRRSCGAISVLQALTVIVMAMFVITLVVLGSPPLLAALIASGLLTAVLSPGRLAPRRGNGFAWGELA